jgi:hypothetical protein
LAILLALALCAWWMLIGRVSAARLLLLAVGATGVTLLASVMLFGGVGSALWAMDIDPTYVVGLAPWWWGACGLSLVAIAVRYVRGVGLQAIRERLALPELRGRGGCLYGIGLVACSTLSLMIAARHFINDSDQEGGTVASIPYRLFEWGIVDRIPGPVSDECLANRVLEYGKYDRNGTDARDELDLRGDSAVPGVVARLNQLADHWPPKPHTVTRIGIVMLLGFLERQGEVNTVRRWKQIPYNKDMENIEESSGWLF